MTGLDLLGDRNYDPATGHFLQRDPVQELTDPGQLNGYAYAADNPLNGSDPDGKCVRLDDASGPCAETANTPAGKKRLKGIENDRRRQEAHWRAAPAENVIRAGHWCLHVSTSREDPVFTNQRQRGDGRRVTATT